jgi:hypothetical protein
VQHRGQICANDEDDQQCQPQQTTDVRRDFQTGSPLIKTTRCFRDGSVIRTAGA